MTKNAKEADRNAIADRLRQAREYLGLSQDDVAGVLGLSRPAISHLEAGTRKVEATELSAMAALYRQNVEFLLTGRQPAPDVPEQLRFLARSIKGLSEKDLTEVARFATFLQHSSDQGRKG